MEPGLDDIRRRIAAAERAARREPGSVTLIAVSKLQPQDRVDAVLRAGQTVFGENYVQEARSRWASRPDGVSLHMIGPLQSNKARAALELFDAIHTLDRASLARKLAAQIGALGRAPTLFVQINTGDEDQKAGIAPGAAEAFLAECRSLGLAPRGLMCIPPEAEDPRPHFRLLRDLAARMDLPLLSMGMSADFEDAIAEGATHVRVGSAIFGARPPR